LDNGIKPIWVFDGEPPKLKSGEVIIFLCGLKNKAFEKKEG